MVFENNQAPWLKDLAGEYDRHQRAYKTERSHQEGDELPNIKKLVHADEAILSYEILNRRNGERNEDHRRE